MKRFLVIGLMLLTACGQPGAPRLRIAVASGLMEVFPMYLCQQLGNLQKEGIDATIESLPGAKGFEALIGESVDVFYDSPIGVLTAAGRGKRLKVFFVGQRTVMSMLIVSQGKAEKIRSVGDLKGATIGVGGLGAPQHMFLGRILRVHGLDLADVHVIAYGFGPPAISALERGQVDAGMINGSAFPVLRQRTPVLRVLADPRTPQATEALLGRDYANFSLIATPEWLARNPDTARKLTRALMRTMQWVIGHSAEEVLAKIPAHLRSAYSEGDLESLRLIIAGLSEDGHMRPGGPEILRQLAGVPMEKLREHGIELTQTYTNEFLEGK